MSKKEAYVTLVATDSYASGALVLAHRLLDLGTQKELVCLVTKNISKIVLEHLGQLYQLIPVDTLYSNDLDNLQLLGRPDLNITFTKIHVWKLTQYKKVVFLDADTLPLKNVDELFERPNFSAAHDCGWPDTFNSGVFVTEPSESDYQALKKMAIENGSFDGGDQGLLNKYFSSWSASSSDHRLPFTYNMTPTSQYTYAPALQYYSNNIAICHFIGLNKPWKYQRYSDGSVFSHQWKGYTDLLQSWWNTWNLHYGQTEPDHLLSRSPNDIVIYSYKRQPIPQFNHFTENVWDNINFHNYMEDHHHHRHIIPMPPVDKITITHSDWIDNKSSHHYDETSQCSSHQIDEEQSEHFGPEKHGSTITTTTTDLRQNDYNQSNKEGNLDSHTNYQMVNWNPACESPPNQGMSANIPDLSEYDNAWDKPVDYNSVWIAPDPQPVPKFDFNYEFVHEHQEYRLHDQHYQHEQQYQHEHQYEQHQHEHQYEHQQREYDEQYHEYNHQEHHKEIKPKEIHRPVFPWEYRQEPVSTPTRIWLDELVRTTQRELEGATVDESLVNKNKNCGQDQHIQNSNNDSHDNQYDATSQVYNIKDNSSDDRVFEVMNEASVENINSDQNKSTFTEHAFDTQSDDINVSNNSCDDNNDLQMDEAASNSVAYAMDTISYKSIVRNLGRSQKANREDTIKNDQKNESYPITSNDDVDDDDDRQFIPIPFKATSKLNPGGLSSTPVQSPIGSRRSSVSKSRRSSLSSQKSNSSSILSPVATKSPIIYTENIISRNYFQPSQTKSNLVQANLSFSKKTPYTSAATTPTKEYASFIYDIDGLSTLSTNNEAKKKTTTTNEIHTDFEKLELAFDYRTPNHIGEEFNEKNTKQDEVKEDIPYEEEEGDDYYNQYSIDKSLQSTYNSHRDNNNGWDPELALELLRAQSNHIISNHEYKGTVDELITIEESDHQNDIFFPLINSTKITSHVDNNDTLNVGYNNDDNIEATNQSQYSWDSIVIPSSKQDINSLYCKDYVLYKNVSDEIQSAGTTSPTTPIVRSLKNNLTFEIEAAKEQHRQQRAALALVQPKTAIATVLEAELDLTKSSLFNRRSRNHVFIDNIDNSNNSTSNAISNNFKTITKDTYTINEFDLTPDRDSIHEKINTSSLHSNQNNDLNISYFSLNNIKSTLESAATTSTQTTGFNVKTWRDDVNNSFKQEGSEVRRGRIEEYNNNTNVVVADDEEVEEEYAAYFDSSIINAAKNKMKELVTECTLSTSSYNPPSSPTINIQNNSNVTTGESSQSNKNTSLQNLSRYTFTEPLYGLPSQPFHPYITMKNLKSGPPSPSNVSTLSLGSIASNNQSKALSQGSDHSISSGDNDEGHMQKPSLFFSGIDDYHQDQTSNIAIQNEVNLTVENEQAPPQPSSSFFVEDIDNRYCAQDKISQTTIQNIANQAIKNEHIPSQPSSICSETREIQNDLNKIIQLSVESSSISSIKDSNFENKTVSQEPNEITNIITTASNPSPTTSAQSLSIIEKSTHGDLYSDEQNISTWLSLTANSDELDDDIKNNDDDKNRDIISYGIQGDNNNEKDENHTHTFDGTIINDISPKGKKSKLLTLAQSSPLLLPTTGVSMRKDLQRVIQSDHEVRPSSSLTSSTSISSISSLPPASSVTDDGETVYLSALEDISDITSVEWRSAASATPIIDDPNDDDIDNNNLFINDSDNNSDSNSSFNLDHHLVTIENNMVNTSTSTNEITTITTTTTVTNEMTIIKTTTTTTNAATDASSDENSSLESDHTII